MSLSMHELDRETIRQLSQPSNGRGLVQLGAHLALLAASGTLVWAARGTYWLVAALFVHGVILSFLFCALHETVHRTAFASRRLNDLVASFSGAVLLLPPRYFRLFHFAHHRHTQDPANDPELAAPHPTTLSAYIWRVSGLPNWYNRLTVTLRHAVSAHVPERFVPEAKRSAVVREARLLWTVYLGVLGVSLLLHSDAALLYWILPALLGQPVLRLYLLSEHIGCTVDDNAYANTRTTYTNAAVRLLTWQMPYHVEHHAYPAVPFHALVKVNTHIRSGIVTSAPGYLALHRAVLRSFRQ
jgi:fatty acid desaturase